MNKYKKLLGNSAIFAIGNLGSKLISIILVPLYTYYLSTTEYGLIDIVTTSASMMLPIVSMSIYEAVLRFTMDKKSKKNEIFTNALMTTIIGCILLWIFYPIVARFTQSDNLVKYIYIILILQAFQTLFSQFARAIGYIGVYTINGVIMTIITGVLSVTLITCLNMGIDGYMLSIIGGNLISIVFLFISCKLHRYINIGKFNKKTIVLMLMYSVPLIPNSFIWWIMSASSRYFILYFVGASANGLFAFANKIPSLLTILNNVFFQAWQLSAIEEYDSQDKGKFYTEVFSFYCMFMFLGASSILAILKYIMRSFISPEYYDAWKLIPLLIFGVIFSSFASFLGTNYIAAKQTKGVFRTSIVGGIISIALNFILIPYIGTNGAGVSTVISFLVIWILRVFETRKFINMKMDIKLISLNLFLLINQSSLLYLNINVHIELAIELILLILLAYINRRIFFPLKHLLFMLSSSSSK